MTVIPDEHFDEASPSFAAMSSTAAYIDTRIGTTGNLTPSAYAASSDVAAIAGKIPSAASTSNQLADKAYVAAQISSAIGNAIGGSY